MNNIQKPNIERLLMTIKGDGLPDRVPTFENAYEGNIVEYFLKRKAGSTFAGSRGVKEDSFYDPPMDPWDFIELVNHTGQDAIALEAAWVPFKYKDEKGVLHIIDHGMIKGFDDLDRIVKPNWEMDFGPRKKYMNLYKQATQGTDIGFAFSTGCLFQYCYQFLVGFEDFFVLLYTDRKFIETVLDICMEYYLKITEMAIDTGIDFLYLADDIAFKSGPFVKKDILEELWLPRIKRLVRLGKDANLPIMFHSCGNITEIFEDIILELGVDGVHPIEPYSMDIFKIKSKYGDRITIQGNIDIAGPLATGTPKQVRQVVRNHLEKLMPGGRYILSTSHSVTDDIPPENYIAMRDTLFEYGRY
ncbi:MAG: uroporphyrinogen decarboxylase family protein [Mahellales bacterium]